MASSPSGCRRSTEDSRRRRASDGRPRSDRPLSLGDLVEHLAERPVGVVVVGDDVVAWRVQTKWPAPTRPVVV
jgi:hypothetical protein